MMTRWFNSLPYVSPIVNEFIITVKTDNAGVSASNEILLPIQGTNMVIDWGDGSVSTHTQTLAPNNTIGGNNVVKTYASAGVYQIKISTSITRVNFSGAGDRLKLLEINNWGDANWSTFDRAFDGCANMIGTYNDAPKSFLGLRLTFNGCSLFNSPVNDFNPIFSSSIPIFGNTLLQETFSGCTLFNQDVNNWNVENVTSCQGLFQNCLSFNKPLLTWNLANCTDFRSMFRSASQFNQEVNQFNVSNAILINSMFREALQFNKALNNWNILNVTNFNEAFITANSFNQDIGNFVLNPSVSLINLLNTSETTLGMNTENYSRTLIGWANNIFSRGGVVTGRTLGALSRRYNNINYVSGQQFNNAVDARNYLVNTLGWTITGDAQV